MPQNNDFGAGAFGPFSELLAQPAHQPGPQPTGWETKGPQIAYYANQFLEGMSRSRRQKFEQGEQAQQRLWTSTSQAMHNLNERQQNPATALAPEKYQEAVGKLEALQIGLVAKHVDGVKGKGGKDGGNPAFNTIKGVLDSITGPRPAKYEVGAEQVYSALHDVYSAASDPKNTSAYALKAQDEAFSQGYSALRKELGREPTAQEIFADKRTVEPYRTALQTVGGDAKHLPGGMTGILSMAQPQQTEEEKARIDQMKASAEASRAMAKFRESPEYEIYQNKSGDAVKYNKLDGKFYDMSGKEITDPSKTQGLTKIAVPQRDQIRMTTDRNGVLQRVDLTTGESKAVVDSKGRPVLQDTPLGRALAIQNRLFDHQDVSQYEREKNSLYRKLTGDLDMIERDKKYKTDKGLQQRAAEIKEAMQTLGVPEKAEPRTTTPPKAGDKKDTGKKASGMSDADAEAWAFKNIFGVDTKQPSGKSSASQY